MLLFCKDSANVNEIQVSPQPNVECPVRLSHYLKFNLRETNSWVIYVQREENTNRHKPSGPGCYTLLFIIRRGNLQKITSNIKTFSQLFTPWQLPHKVPSVVSCGCAPSFAYGGSSGVSEIVATDTTKRSAEGAKSQKHPSRSALSLEILNYMRNVPMRNCSTMAR